MLMTLAASGVTVFKDVAAGIQSVVTALGVIVGGAWAYRTFIQQRDHKPKCETRHAVAHRRAADGLVILSVDVVMANNGSTLIELHEAVLLVKQMLPLPGHVRRRLAGDRGPNDAEVSDWPVLAASTSLAVEPRTRLEPGEEAAHHVDFIVSDDVEMVAIYTHCRDRTHAGTGLGWDCTTLHDLASGEAPSLKDDPP